MDYICKKLLEIKEKPEYFLNAPTLQSLSDYIGGYWESRLDMDEELHAAGSAVSCKTAQHADQNEDLIFPEFQFYVRKQNEDLIFPEFQFYVRKHYNLKDDTPEWYDSMYNNIASHSNSEREAFEKFFELLEAFIECHL
ncbi:MAG: hypothetical protein FWG87_13480 [Defluviitaleaceae bacterium]|nr:hypothetical protein [Defluviitaleaceae bacterium]